MKESASIIIHVLFNQTIHFFNISLFLAEHFQGQGESRGLPCVSLTPSRADSQNSDERNSPKNI